MSRYYEEDKDVKEDVELQAYLNEVSLKGTGPNGGIGRVNMKMNHQAYLLSKQDVAYIYPSIVSLTNY